MAERLVTLTIRDPALDVRLQVSDPPPPSVTLRVNDQPGGFAVVSRDPDNRLTRGSDGGLLVPDTLTPDPLAYYILARS